MKKLLNFPFSPLLFTYGSVLIFYFRCHDDATIHGLTSTIILASLIVFSVWFILFLIIHDQQKSHILILIFSILFFSFQSFIGSLIRFASSIKSLELTGFLILNVGQWVIFTFFALLLFCFFLIIRRVERIQPVIPQYLNIFGILFFSIVLIRGSYSLENHSELRANFLEFWKSTTQIEQVRTENELANMPDIYYIILDGFGRSDTLFRLYELDNLNFINEMLSEGFYIADESYANYTQTRTSLASSLNMIYLDDVVNVIGDDTFDYYPAYLMIKDSIVENTFRALGYEMVAFPSDVSFTNFHDWDVFYQPKFVPDYYLRSFISSTALSVFLNSFNYKWHSEMIDFTIKKIPIVGTREGPQFVFAHIPSPHPPFIYNSDGTVKKGDSLYLPVDASHLKSNFSSNKAFIEYYEKGYRNKLIYLQNRILGLIKQIKSNSSDPYLIIIQGDHGPGMRFDHESLERSDLSERLGILNAYYFYDQNYESLYPTISPVNSFRLIFQQYYDFEKPLLEDNHYYSTYSNPFDLFLVDDLLR